MNELLGISARGGTQEEQEVRILGMCRELGCNMVQAIPIYRWKRVCSLRHTTRGMCAGLQLYSSPSAIIYSAKRADRTQRDAGENLCHHTSLTHRSSKVTSADLSQACSPARPIETL